jgi:hypothetical protein
MIHLRSLYRAYFALWLMCLFGALCFITGYWACTLTAIAMLRAA